jgi:hypothetical protein
VTQTAATLDFTQPLSLNCFLLGDDLDRMFTVKIDTTETVSILKKLIKEENPSSLGNVDVKNIDLWHVSFPIDDLSKETTIAGPKLKSEKLLSDVFHSELNTNCIHVFSRVSGPGEYIDSGFAEHR